MKNNIMEKIAITTGDPNGIGAEITIKALNMLDIPSDKVVLISNKAVLDYYGKLNKNYEIIEIPYCIDFIEPGKVSKFSGEFSFQSLQKACEIKPSAIVTAPVAKKALHLAGHFFNGQTEVLEYFLAHDNQLAEMLFVADNFRVLLLTRHCALKDITLTKEMVKTKVRNLVQTFRTQFCIHSPKFALCGFNPHSGEDGILGNEEIEILIPAVKELQDEGINITMPLPADTLFVKAAKAYYECTNDEYDCYIANYHDQGLIPIKTVAGDKTVNMTIGLDILRTSPGHGTAFDIAGKDIADPTAMISAIVSVFNQL
ncbi:MAG: 4-hydroxythreonine-4-phosphate dehydrogenase PdxA [Cyanobacteria bacterium SIG26]|nr:4-hydroxythreonine-4-phosphate dehydrogenase PdxA [Cyanobacteria bacterium SIG26]